MNFPSCVMPFGQTLAKYADISFCNRGNERRKGAFTRTAFVEEALNVRYGVRTPFCVACAVTLRGDW
jgi:hypothetical protein